MEEDDGKIKEGKGDDYQLFCGCAFIITALINEVHERRTKSQIKSLTNSMLILGMVLCGIPILIIVAVIGGR